MANWLCCVNILCKSHHHISEPTISCSGKPCINQNWLILFERLKSKRKLWFLVELVERLAQLRVPDELEVHGGARHAAAGVTRAQCLDLADPH